MKRYLAEAPEEANFALALYRIETSGGAAFNVSPFKGEPTRLEAAQTLFAAFVFQLSVMSVNPGDVYDDSFVAALEAHLASIEKLHAIVGATMQHKAQVDEMLLSGMCSEQVIEAIQEGGDLEDDDDEDNDEDYGRQSYE
jgi:hypothetical protein